MEKVGSEPKMSSQNLLAVYDNFFIITSDNLDSVKTKLYGYCVSRGQVIVDTEDIHGGGIA